jgi:cupin fold WbuC family metalloprotein
LNVLLRGTYVTPHRHIDPPKPEAFLVLTGAIKIVLFDDVGQPEAVHRLTAPGTGPAWGIDLDPGIWHTILAESDTAVCYEVKPGPYTAASDKDFAPWAPRENQPGWREYLAMLEAL